MKRRREGSFRKIVWKCLIVLKKQALEFCRETGLHGYKYIGEPQRSLAERIGWAIAAFTSLCIAVGIIKYTFHYYTENSVSSVIKSTHHGIWNYPFPAVTVCDMNRVSLKLSRKLVENLKLQPAVSKEFIVQEMRLLNELLYPGRTEGSLQNNFSRLQSIFDRNDLSIPTVINSVTRNCESLLVTCKIKSVQIDCNRLFERSFTADGVCCSYNYITAKNINENQHQITKRTTSCGYRSGLSIVIKLDPDDYHASMIGTVGAKIILHDPYNYPDFDASNKMITIEKYSFLTVRPEETYSTDNIRSLSPSQRSCMFSDEPAAIKRYKNKEINFTTAKYSFTNCMAECRASVIKTKCGCIPYYYPQNGTRVCNLRDTECLETFKFWYATSWPGTDMSPKTLPFVHVDTNQRPCGCLPDCNFYRYTMENSLGNLDRHVSDTSYTSNGQTWENQSTIHIFFGDLVSIQYRRDVHYNWRHIFATSGGLLGLFAGFSLMSIFEFFYFFVIRVITDACTKRSNTENTKLSVQNY